MIRTFENLVYGLFNKEAFLEFREGAVEAVQRGIA